MTYWQIVTRDSRYGIAAENYEAPTAEKAVKFIMSMQVPGTELVKVWTVEEAEAEYKRTGKKLGEE